jgi:hypothetical protein
LCLDLNKSDPCEAREDASGANESLSDAPYLEDVQIVDTLAAAQRVVERLCSFVVIEGRPVYHAVDTEARPDKNGPEQPLTAPLLRPRWPTST